MYLGMSRREGNLFVSMLKFEKLGISQEDDEDFRSVYARGLNLQ